MNQYTDSKVQQQNHCRESDHYSALPEGWEMYIDPVTGWPVYVDHNTRSTTWQHPRHSSAYQPSSSRGMRTCEIPVMRDGTPSFRGQPSVVREIPIHIESARPENINCMPAKSGNGEVASGGLYQKQQPDSMKLPRYGMGGFVAPTRTDSEHPAPRHFTTGDSNTTAGFGTQHVAREIPIVFETTPGPNRAESAAKSDTSQANLPGQCRTTADMKQTVDQKLPTVIEPQSQNDSITNCNAENDASSRQTADVPAADALTVEPPVKRMRTPSPAPQNLTPLEVIEQILSEASQLKADVDNFDGKRGEKRYLVLEEMLTRLLIKLDLIDSEGREDIRNARRLAVRTVQSILDLLESKASNNSGAACDKQLQSPEPMECSDVNTVKDNEVDSNIEKNNADDTAAIAEMILPTEVQC